jgi:uncharacterized protein (DUF169 family)
MTGDVRLRIERNICRRMYLCLEWRGSRKRRLEAHREAAVPERPTTWQEAARRLRDALHLNVAPIAITFGTADAAPFAAASDPMPEPTPDGRTGRVPAGCVFWVHALERTFSTLPEDHGNCSVGSLTHGLIDLATAAARADVGALVEAGWVTPDIFSSIPTVTSRPDAITYGPLADATAQPDVVLVRTDARGIMTIGDAVADLSIEGKPQCHIVAIAKEQQRPVASVGCALSRARTGMGAHELTCALPGARLEKTVSAIEAAASVDTTVARHAAADTRRFAAAT